MALFAAFDARSNAGCFSRPAQMDAMCVLACEWNIERPRVSALQRAAPSGEGGAVACVRAVMTLWGERLSLIGRPVNPISAHGVPELRRGDNVFN